MITRKELIDCHLCVLCRRHARIADPDGQGGQASVSPALLAFVFDAKSDDPASEVNLQVSTVDGCRTQAMRWTRTHLFEEKRELSKEAQNASSRGWTGVFGRGEELRSAVLTTRDGIQTYPYCEKHFE